MKDEYNRNGGLTLVPLPGFIGFAQSIKTIVEEIGKEKRHPVKVDIAIPRYGERASGEPYVELGKKHIGGHDCVVLTSGPGTYRMLVQLQFTLAYLVGRRASRIVIVTGYFPLSRSDKDEGEEELALVSIVVHMMESLAYGHLDRIIAVDLHAAQEVAVGSKPGLITEVSLARRVLQKVITDIKKANRNARICILFPDEGSQKRFETTVETTVAELRMTVPIVCGQKRRISSHKTKLIGIFGDTESIKGAHVIGFDDEIATGDTNTATAEVLKNKFGARAYYAAVVHGMLCGPAPDLLASPACGIDRIYVADTILVEIRPELERLVKSGRLVIIPWVKELAGIIYRHHLDKNIRPMR